MKNWILSVVVIMLLTNTYAQGYIDDITKQSCDCLKGLNEDINYKEAQVKLSLCMLDASSQYSKKLKKDYKVDIDKMNAVEGEKLGRIIGLKMASTCPDALLKVVKKTSDSDEEDIISNNSFTGEVTNINDDKFIEFSIKNSTGKTEKFYWLTYINSTIDMEIGYKKLKNKNIEVMYITKEFFDARILEYRNVNIITELAIIE